MSENQDQPISRPGINPSMAKPSGSAFSSTPSNPAKPLATPTNRTVSTPAPINKPMSMPTTGMGKKR